jgi:hypothetical protein
MKFTIEVLRIGDGAEEILARSEHDAIAPKWMKTRAQTVLNAWKKRGANGIRVLNRGASRSIAGERISSSGSWPALAAMLWPPLIICRLPIPVQLKQKRLGESFRTEHAIFY